MTLAPFSENSDSYLNLNERYVVIGSNKIRI